MTDPPALVTLLAVLPMSGTAFAVGFARGRYKIAVPATSGHPAFELGRGLRHAPRPR